MPHPPKPRWRWLKRLAIALVFLVAAAASPIFYVETQCRVTTPASAAPSAFPIDDPHYRRAEGDSYLTYPEWYIVHAYADLAAVARQKSESAFDYLASVTGFWRSLCVNTRAAESVGPVTLDQRVTDYIIGDSFSAEMLIIGAYERSLGALTAWARGDAHTAEDDFALRIADDYAAFLQQAAWYQYPFFPTLERFWRETPFGQGSLARSAERRLALTLEYGGKGLYAIPIGALAGASPADLTIQSVVEGLTEEDLAADPRIRRLRDLGGGATLIETPRYQEFTKILLFLAERGRRVLEIAGNRHILTTIVAPANVKTPPEGRELFSLPIQSQPDKRRLGVDVEVEKLADFIRAVARQGGEFEHAYDY